MGKQVTLIEYAKKTESNKKQARKLGSLAFFFGPYFISFAMFFLFPFIFGLILSLCSFDGTSMLPNNFVWFANFQKVFTARVMIKDFWSAVWYTFRFALIIVPLCIIIPLCLALLTNIKPFGYKFFRACIYLPGIFPLTATGLILLQMFSKYNGFVNSLFNTSIDWFGETLTAWIMVGIFCIWGGIGGNYIIMNAGLENVDKTLYEAGNMDGVNKWQRFKYITFPGIKNQFVMCLFTTLIGYMNLYGQNFILLGNTADQDSVMTAIYRIQNMLMGSSKNYGYAAAMAICLGVIIGVITTIQMIITRDRKGGDKHEKDFMAWKESQ